MRRWKACRAGCAVLDDFARGRKKPLYLRPDARGLTDAAAPEERAAPDVACRRSGNRVEHRDGPRATDIAEPRRRRDAAHRHVLESTGLSLRAVKPDVGRSRRRAPAGVAQAAP